MHKEIGFPASILLVMVGPVSCGSPSSGYPPVVVGRRPMNSDDSPRRVAARPRVPSGSSGAVTCANARATTAFQPRDAPAVYLGVNG